MLLPLPKLPYICIVSFVTSWLLTGCCCCFFFILSTLWAKFLQFNLRKWQIQAYLISTYRAIVQSVPCICSFLKNRSANIACSFSLALMSVQVTRSASCTRTFQQNTWLLNGHCVAGEIEFSSVGLTCSVAEWSQKATVVLIEVIQQIYEHHDAMYLSNTFAFIHRGYIYRYFKSHKVYLFQRMNRDKTGFISCVLFETFKAFKAPAGTRTELQPTGKQEAAKEKICMCRGRIWTHNRTALRQSCQLHHIILN